MSQDDSGEMIELERDSKYYKNHQTNEPSTSNRRHCSSKVYFRRGNRYMYISIFGVILIIALIVTIAVFLSLNHADIAVNGLYNNKMSHLRLNAQKYIKTIKYDLNFHINVGTHMESVNDYKTDPNYLIGMVTLHLHVIKDFRQINMHCGELDFVNDIAINFSDSLYGSYRDMIITCSYPTKSTFSYNEYSDGLYNFTQTLHVTYSSSSLSKSDNYFHLSNDDQSLLVIHLKNFIKADSFCTIEFPSYLAIINKLQYNGMHIIRYRGPSSKIKSIVTTQMEPNFARKVFPCFDEPSYKAFFNITISHHKNYTALSNGKLIHSVDSPYKDIVIDYFDTTPYMSTYTIAIILSDFVRIPVPVNLKYPLEVNIILNFLIEM
ncbi:hypothetical protein A3Q56_04739 [Intoshia linei]|uniref:Aminopeptidase N-like N-terminal domain-containing protein n=1 Tax=Intoshia linei TaxID=1819745 RepID=A0A177AZS4_9BILA|nr:hypothetical protein A3Q56_04739 [Intoshia linei]